MTDTKYRTTLALATAIILTLSLPAAGLCQRLYSVSIPAGSLGLEKGERVGAFQVDIYGGQIVSVPRVPPDWHVLVLNRSNQTARLRASGGVFSAFVGPDFFKGFIRISKYYRDRQGPGIRIELRTMAAITWKQRLIILGKNKVMVKKVKQAARYGVAPFSAESARGPRWAGSGRKRCLTLRVNGAHRAHSWLSMDQSALGIGELGAAGETCQR